MKTTNHIPYILLSVFGEFLLLLDAGFVGWIMEHGTHSSPFQLEIILFWGFLFGGIILKYFSEKCKNNEPLPILRNISK
jgi:hypothetical protein